MNPDDRSDLYERYITSTISRELPLLRFLTVVWYPEDAGDEEPPREAIVDSQDPDFLRLIVRSVALTEAQRLILSGRGFGPAFETDDPGMVSYEIAIDGASVDELVTFVEWVFRSVFEAPDDYEPMVVPLDRDRGPDDRSSCTKSCAKTAAFIIVIFVVLFVIGMFAASK